MIALNFFFEHAERIAKADYVPTQEDILRARLRSTGIEEAEFLFQDLAIVMVDVGGQRSERRKWLHCFTDVNAILFVASLSCYDQFLREDVTQNSMVETLLLWQEVNNSEHFQSNEVILFLNKIDLFEQKIMDKPLSGLFLEYTGGTDKEQAMTFLRDKFLEVTRNRVYVHTTCALDTSNIRFVVNDICRVLLASTIRDEMNIKL